MLAFSTPSSPSRAFLIINGQAAQVIPSILRMTFAAPAALAGAEIIHGVKANVRMSKDVDMLFIVAFLPFSKIL